MNLESGNTSLEQFEEAKFAYEFALQSLVKKTIDIEVTPTNPEDTQSSKPNQTPSKVQTSDSTCIIIFAGLAFLSIIGIVMIYRYRHQK